jgi:hypothetical protein
MNDFENRERVEDQQPVPASENNNNHVPAKIGVYNRPERNGLSLLHIAILAILLMVAAVIIYQLVL